MLLRDDEQQIEALYQSGDKALMTADVEVLSQILAADYIQYGDSGQPLSKQKILENIRTGAVRCPSISSRPAG